ncbi:MAG: hypothetical protein MR871_03255 [Lachnospiraceae bacterium]|nr:hypothetical protein [Lachnospiraceae bacterium]
MISHKPHRIDKCTSFVQWVVTQVRKEKWSIDACVGYARKHKLFPEEKMVCTKTLYNEIWAGNLSLNVLELPEAIKRKKHHKNKDVNCKFKLDTQRQKNEFHLSHSFG